MFDASTGFGLNVGTVDFVVFCVVVEVKEAFNADISSLRSEPLGVRIEADGDAGGVGEPAYISSISLLLDAAVVSALLSCLDFVRGFFPVVGGR